MIVASKLFHDFGLKGIDTVCALQDKMKLQKKRKGYEREKLILTHYAAIYNCKNSSLLKKLAGCFSLLDTIQRETCYKEALVMRRYSHDYQFVSEYWAADMFRYHEDPLIAGEEIFDILRQSCGKERDRGPNEWYGFLAEA